MLDKELTQRVLNAKEFIGNDSLINEFLGWMTKDDLKLFIENIEKNWDIDTFIDVNGDSCKEDKDEEDTKFVAYGDVNPLQHGGIWVRKDRETSYLVVKIDAIDENPDNGYVLSNCYIDVNDVWIDKARVISYADTPMDDDVRFAMDVVSYYGAYECSGEEERFETEEQVIKELAKYEIEVS